MFMDCITYQGVPQVVAEQMMLQDLEHRFCKSHSSLEKIGFPTPSAANVANMLATCHNDTRFCSNFGQMGRCCWHKIEDVGTFCVSLSRHPYFPPKNQTSPSAYVEIYYRMGVTYAQIRTLMLSAHCSGHQLSNCLKKTSSWWQKGRELAVKLGYGMTVLVALEEERGEVDTYMVLSSYYYNMSAIKDTTRHTTQKNNWHRMMLATCQLCRAIVLGRHKDMSSILTFDDIKNVEICS